jgi:hypothetical protein
MMNEYYLETKAVIDSIQMGTGGKKRKCAIFVMVKNEKIFLPIWLKYYSRYFPGDDIYVFDHKSDDGSVEECTTRYKFRKIRLEYPFSFDHPWFKFVAGSMQKRLLEHYEYVLFTDVDEILLPLPGLYAGLDDYINKLKKTYVRCRGFELIHLKDREDVYDSNKSVLSQREYWHKNKWFNKTLLSRRPLEWRVGFHQVSRIMPHFDNNLMLVHLHKFDYDYCWNKSLERSKLQWADEEIKKKRGWQNRITDKDEFDNFYFKWPKRIKIVKIPEEIKRTDIF